MTARMRGNMTVNAGAFRTFLKELVNTGYIKISTGPGTWEKDIFRADVYKRQEFEELIRKTIADIVSEASSVACWVYVQKYVKHKTLNEMLQELPDVSQFILAMDTWFEKLMEK